MNFEEKAIFLWCYWDISEDPEVVAGKLVEGGFEAVYVHTNDGPWEGSYGQMQQDGSYKDRLNCTDALVSAFRARGLKVNGWGAPYGRNLAGEIAIMVSQTKRYQLDGYIIDAEGTWDTHPNVVTDTRTIITEYKAACPGVPVAWCWWPLYESSTGVPWHPVAVLREAMQYADVGMPMAYWEGFTSAHAVAYLNRSWSLWRRVTGKPIIPAGRAWTGDGGEATRAAVLAFDARARELGAPGISWWDAQHAVKLPQCWQALIETKKFNSEEQPMTDWTKNAIGLYTRTAGWTNKAFNFIVGYAGGEWSKQGDNLVIEPNPNLKSIELQAHAEIKPFIALWDFDVEYYSSAQIDANEGSWPPEAKDYPLQRLIAALTSRNVDGLIIRVMNRKNLAGKNEMMKYVGFAARKFVERANKWLYQNKGLDKWTFVLTNDDFLRSKESDGTTSQEHFYTWLKDWYIGIEKEATRPLDQGAWPQQSDAPGAIPPSLGWKFWYHYNATALDMMIFNGDNSAMRALLGYNGNADTIAPTPPAGLASSVSGSSVILTWSPSTDGVGVAGYRIYRGGVKVLDTTGLSASFSNQAAGTYVYGVSAFDAAGNESAKAEISVVIKETDVPVTRAEFEALKAMVIDQERQVDDILARINRHLLA